MTKNYYREWQTERETEREGEGERKREKDRQGESFTNFQIILTKCDSYYKVR